MTEQLHVEYLDIHCPKLAYKSASAAGIDLPAAWNADSQSGDWLISPGASLIVDVPIKLAIPEGYYGRVVMRSGHGFKHDLFCHIGTVDADYRGPLKVKVFNYGHGYRTIEAYERFAQLIIQPYVQVEILQTDTIHIFTSDRGEAGFGSTGQ